MRTLVISDLHLGARTGVDLLRRAELRAPLLAALAEVQRVVLLGDALELRHGPTHQALTAARPFFEELGDALGPRGQVVLVPGNHDHELLAPWLVRRRSDAAPAPLGLAEAIPVAPDGAVGRIAGWLGAAELALAYPGVWLRDDVYAIHGHYLDCHITVPTFERLAIGVVGRVVGQVPAGRAAPADYEAQLTPLYALIDAIAQGAPTARTAGLDGASVRAWQTAVGSGGRWRWRARALRATVRPAIAGLNRAGIGPLAPALSGEALRRGGLAAIGEAIARLGVDATHVIFGHTHRAGPWPGDDEAEWMTRSGARLHNSGSWVYERHFLTDRPNESPYWPGSCVELSDDGAPPRLRRLLGARTHVDLRPPPPG